MNIVEIIPQLSSGGAERFVVDLCNDLSTRHEVTLITYFDLIECGFYASELSPSITVISMNKSKGLSLTLSSRLRKIIRNINPDVIHLHSRAIYYALPSLMNNHIVSFMTIHSDAYMEAGSLLGKLLRKLCFSIGLVKPVTISNESLKSFRNCYCIDAPMIPNGRNVNIELKPSEESIKEFEKYRKTDSTRVLVNIARFNNVKRQDLLARVVRKLSEEGYDICLLLIGRCSETAVLEKVNDVACDNIHILGEKDNPLEYLKLSDAFCLCSSYEGMPISLIEAMGMGVIPICTPVGGIVDVINEENGFLSSDDTEESYYIALKSYLETNMQKLNVMKKLLLQSYLPLSMTRCAGRYEELFKEACHER